MKKNSLDALLKVKALKDEKQAEPIIYKVPGSDEEIIINRLSETETYEIMNSMESTAPIMALWDSLIYAAMPELREKEVLEKFNCLENPESIVGEIFTMGERVEIGRELKLAVDGVNIERLKNE